MQSLKIRYAACSLILSLLAVAVASAQEKPTITPDDYGQWESLGSQNFSPDGRWLAACSMESWLNLWHAPSLEEIEVMEKRSETE